MNSNIKFLALLCMATLIFSACDDDDPIIVDPPELITTLTYTLTPAGGGSTVVLSFQDLDGDGGASPVVSNGTLTANTTYNGSLSLLNESVTPTEVITDEIEEEADEHQFFFQSNISGLSVGYDDEDENGLPVGLENTLSTGASGSGNMTVTLRHEPDKDAAGVSGGDIDNAGGETDIEVTFAIDVQ